jgi:hypothetical protein
MELEQQHCNSWAISTSSLRTRLWCGRRLIKKLTSDNIIYVPFLMNTSSVNVSYVVP